MRVGVGFSDNPDTVAAGRLAVLEALQQAGQDEQCDLVLLFSTARHDARVLRDAVASLVGSSVPIVGGGAVGAISNTCFGYAGDQIGLALFWFKGVRWNLVSEGDLTQGEEEVGNRLGRKLAELGTTPSSQILLFYDSINRTKGDIRLNMATHLLSGIKRELGFLPDLFGAGLMGDHACTPTRQWAGSEIVQQNALALTFSGNVRIDVAVMHGCRPASVYYTVTKADEETILEINGQPALPFVGEVMGLSAISPEEYGFFLAFGMNKGDKWGDYNEKAYVNRLCLNIDKGRNGLIMFEPDMVEGTEFQIMYRSLDLDYMKPKMDALFAGLEGREPVFALYIVCAGRAASYAGLDLEDAVVVQEAVAGRAPLLGIYTGVEIAPVWGQSHGLDWTGVFCLFSVPK